MHPVPTCMCFMRCYSACDRVKFKGLFTAIMIRVLSGKMLCIRWSRSRLGASLHLRSGKSTIELLATVADGADWQGMLLPPPRPLWPNVFLFEESGCRKKWRRPSRQTTRRRPWRQTANTQTSNRSLHCRCSPAIHAVSHQRARHGQQHRVSGGGRRSVPAMRRQESRRQGRRR